MLLTVENLERLSEELDKQPGSWGTLTALLDKGQATSEDEAWANFPIYGVWVQVWPADYVFNDEGDTVNGVAMRLIGDVLPAFSSGYGTYCDLDDLINNNSFYGSTFAYDDWRAIIEE